MTTLRRYLVRKRIISAISKEHLRRMLQSLGITPSGPEPGKWSNDSLYEIRKGWVLPAYKGAEAGTIDGVVVSFDECGPISLKPHAGQRLVPRRPSRAASGRPTTASGTRKLMGAFDVGADRGWGHVETRR